MLLQALREADVPVVHCLLLLGADANFTDPSTDETPLYVAVKQRDMRLVDVLLQYEINELRSPLRLALDTDLDEITGRILQAFVAEQHLPGCASLSGLHLGALKPSWLSSILAPEVALSAASSASSSRRSSLVLSSQQLEAQKFYMGIRSIARTNSSDVLPLAGSYSPPIARRQSISSTRELNWTDSSLTARSHSDSLLESFGCAEESSSPLASLRKPKLKEISLALSPLGTPTSTPTKRVRRSSCPSPGSPPMTSDCSTPQLDSSGTLLSPEPVEEDSVFSIGEVSNRDHSASAGLDLTDEDLRSPLAFVAPRVPRRVSLSGMRTIPLVQSRTANTDSVDGGPVASNRVKRLDLDDSFEPEDRTVLASPQALRRMIQRGDAAAGANTGAQSRPLQRMPRSPRAANPLPPATTVIRDLDLSDNDIESLDDLQTLPSLHVPLGCLERLDLSQNSLRDFPAPVSEWLRSVHQLLLMQNQLTTLPRGLLRMQALERLSLANNCVSSLDTIVEALAPSSRSSPLTSQGSSPPSSPAPRSPASSSTTPSPKESPSSSPSLLIQDLEPGQLVDLTTLDLSGNSLSTLPAKIPVVFPRLKLLLLNNNRLVSLPSTAPPHFHYLTELNVSGNALESLPEDMFCEMPRLEKLVADNNHLQ